MADLCYSLEYEVNPGPNVSGGLPRQELRVLSPIWRGASLRLEYPDGEQHTLVGWEGAGPGGPGGLRVFWTRHQPQAPAVCLVIGGDAGVRNTTTGQGLPFLALAESLIPRQVQQVIGPRPEPEPRLLL
jgi:hypothetical protein